MDLTAELMKRDRSSLVNYKTKNMLIFTFPGILLLIAGFLNLAGYQYILLPSGLAYTFGSIISHIKSPNKGYIVGCVTGFLIGIILFNELSILVGISFGLFGGTLGGLSFDYDYIWKRILGVSAIVIIISFISIFMNFNFDHQIFAIGNIFVIITIISSSLLPDNGWIINGLIGMVTGHYIFNIFFMNSPESLYERIIFSFIGAFIGFIFIGYIYYKIKGKNINYLSGMKLIGAKIFVLFFVYIGSIIISLPFYNMKMSYIRLLIIAGTGFIIGLYGILLEKWAMKIVHKYKRESQNYLQQVNILIRKNLDIYYEVKTRIKKRQSKNRYEKELEKIKEKLLKSVEEFNNYNREKGIRNLKESYKDFIKLNDKLKMG